MTEKKNLRQREKELQGLLADRIGIHHAFILPVLCYVYIAYYGFRGSRRTGAATT